MLWFKKKAPHVCDHTSCEEHLAQRLEARDKELSDILQELAQIRQQLKFILIKEIVIEPRAAIPQGHKAGKDCVEGNS